MAAEKPAKGEPALIKEYFFNPPESTDGKWKCKLCEGALTWRGSNSGYSAFVQHMKGSHSSTWAPKADIVESPHFEAAVEKVQGGKERELTSLEKNALRPFLRNPAAFDDELNDEAEVGYADSILEHAEAERIVASSKCCNNN